MKNLNKYKHIYDSLILKGLSRDLSKEIYTEKHHIIPKCMGGGDELTNIVELTAREHIIAHMLLAKIYPDNVELLYSINSMTMYSKFTEGRLEGIGRVSTRLISRFRELYSKSQKGKRLSKSHRNKLSAAKIGKKRKPFSEITKSKISMGKKGKPYGTSIKDPNTFLALGWELYDPFSFSTIQKPREGIFFAQYINVLGGTL